MKVSLGKSRLAAYALADLPRSMRWVFLLAMLLAMGMSAGQVSHAAGAVGMAVAVSAYAALYGLRLIEHLRGRPMSAWCDIVDAVLLCSVVLAGHDVDAIVGVSFQLVFFRALLGSTVRVMATVAGCWAAAATALVTHEGSPDLGALGSLVIVGILICGLRSFLLRIQEQERSHKRRLEAVLEALPLAVVVVDPQGAVVQANPAAQDLTGRPAAELGDLHFTGTRGEQLSLTAVAADPLHDVEADLRRADGEARRLMIHSVPTADGVIVAMQDITTQRLYEEHLRAAAFHDPLTGLANRALFESKAAELLASNVPCSVAMLDLDGFKEVNDTLGHRIGDELLQAVAGRLRDLAGPRATVARLGGDEFVVLTEGRPADLSAIFAEPFALGCGPVTGAGSLGVAASTGGEPVADLLAAADAAMYEVKFSRRAAVTAA